MKKLSLLILVLFSTLLFAASGDRFLINTNQDKDLILQVNNGGVQKDAIKITGSTTGVTLNGSLAIPNGKIEGSRFRTYSSSFGSISTTTSINIITVPTDQTDGVINIHIVAGRNTSGLQGAEVSTVVAGWSGATLLTPTVVEHALSGTNPGTITAAWSGQILQLTFSSGYSFGAYSLTATMSIRGGTEPTWNI